MRSASDRVAVIATQVAKSDRRALSEAWYSALHLAHGAPHATVRTPHSAARTGGAIAERPPASPSSAAPVRAFAPSLPAHQQRDRRVHGVDDAEERRRPACAAARRIERAVATLRTALPGHAAQTIDVAGGRVRLLVRSDNGAIRIVAICSGPLREPVERALAHARFALAAGGIGVHGA